MKYLRSINESFESRIRELTNWDLINDVKDMALEYIDEGCTLSIVVTDEDAHAIFRITYNHIKEECEYNEIIEKKFSNSWVPIRLRYYIHLYRMADHIFDYPYTFELVYRSKNAYPEEDIRINIGSEYQYNEYITKIK